jgi:hypothetical protein
MKSIINLTSANRKKIAVMCVVLLPRVGYARVTRSGIIILKKSKWSLCRKRIPVTDIIIKYIPTEIGKLISTKQDQKVYVELFNYRVATVVSLTKYSDKLNLLDEVYKEFIKVCIIEEPITNVVLNYKTPIVDKVETYGIEKTIEKTRHSTSKYKLSDKVEKLKEKSITNRILQIF